MARFWTSRSRPGPFRPHNLSDQIDHTEGPTIQLRQEQPPGAFWYQGSSRDRDVATRLEPANATVTGEE